MERPGITPWLQHATTKWPQWLFSLFPFFELISSSLLVHPRYEMLRNISCTLLKSTSLYSKSKSLKLLLMIPHSLVHEGHTCTTKYSFRFSTPGKNSARISAHAGQSHHKCSKFSVDCVSQNLHSAVRPFSMFSGSFARKWSVTPCAACRKQKPKRQSVHIPCCGVCAQRAAYRSTYRKPSSGHFAPPSRSVGSL